MNLYLVRHGQTFFNQVHRVQGWCDSPLTKEGILQAQQCGQKLKDVNFSSAYCSTSERVVDTAHYILENRDVSLFPLKELKEIHFGTKEGEFEKDVMTDKTTFFKGFRKFGGEDMPDVKKRVMDVIWNIVNTHNKDDNILIVSHGGSIMMALEYVDATRMRQYFEDGNGIDNCSISVIEYKDERFTIKSLNE